MPLGGSTRSIPDRDLLMIYVVRYTVHATVPDHAPGEHPTLSAVYGCLRARFIAEAMCVVSSRFSKKKQVYRLVYISILITRPRTGVSRVRRAGVYITLLLVVPRSTLRGPHRDRLNRECATTPLSPASTPRWVPIGLARLNLG